MLAAKLAAPAALYTDRICLPLPQDTRTPLVLFSAPPGYLQTECLAKALADSGRRALWIRIGADDCDPASLLLALVDGAQHLQPGLGAQTREQMLSHPGPVLGWGPLFAALGEELSAGLSNSGAIVIERFHHLYDNSQAFSHFNAHLLPALTGNIACVLVSHRPLGKADLPAGTQRLETVDLQLGEPAALALGEEFAPGLSRECIRRAIRIGQGRAGVLMGLLGSYRTLGPAVINKAVAQSTSTTQLLSLLASGCLAASGPTAPQSLALATQVEYLHPSLVQAVWGDAALPSGPWLQPLSQQWVRLRSLWRDMFQSTLRISPNTNRTVLLRAAEYLVQSGSLQEAVQLYFQLNELARAAAALNQVWEGMLDAGQWARLEIWLRRLPDDILLSWPWLAYCRGEIEAAQGRLPQARRTFATAAVRFARQAAMDGACQSLLAESTLAGWQKEYDQAQDTARNALQLAQQASLPRLAGWAGWQLGCLAAERGRIQEAAVFFRQSAQALHELQFNRLAEQAAEISDQHTELRRAGEHHYRALQEADVALRSTADSLGRLIASPGEDLPGLLGEQRWSHLPLMLKLTPTLQLPDPPPESRLMKAWRQIAGRWNAKIEQNAAIEALPVFRPDFLDSWSMPAAVDSPALAQETSPAPGSPVQPKPEAPVELVAAEVQALPDGLTIFFLGPFRVFYGSRSIDNWGSRKAQQVFKYLVTHRQYPTPKEVLMESFWPESDPEAARRSLHQAVYLLRQSFKTELGLPCVDFENDSYRIHTDLSVWIDYEEFERRGSAGQRLEQSGQVEQAMAEYRVAEGLYQDDFLIEEPYEDWPANRREYLWEMYLQIVRRLAEYSLEHQEYTAAMALSRRVLAKDNTQESAHQILIRAYLAQGQRQLAMRQYRQCVQVLKQELSLSPGPDTQELYRQIIKAA